MMNRRDFTKAAGLAAMGLAAGALSGQSKKSGRGVKTRPPVHFFSKHLQFLDYDGMSAAAAEIGFDGLDLTVRNKGHVQPEDVKKDLPRAVKAMKAHGLKPRMMATDLFNVDSVNAEEILATASEQGIQYYRMKYYKYDKARSWKDNMDEFRRQLGELAMLNEKYGIHGAYQNHAGSHVGSYMSDVAYLLDGYDVRWVGSQYDIRHATVEGGNAWPFGLEMVKQHIRTIVIKDFIWEQSKGKLKLHNCPVGEGVVDFKRYFKLLRSHGVDPVVSLHSEYELGGAEKGRREITWPKAKVIAAYKKDLDTFRQLWDESYG